MKCLMSILAGTSATVALISGAPAGVAAAQTPAPDRILYGGAIITVDGKDSVAEAVAVKAGKIVAVGTAKNILALAGPTTVVTNLKGRAVIPGLIDSHSHFMGVGNTALNLVDLNSPPIGKVSTIDDLVGALADRAKTVPPGGTIRGRGYDDTLLAEGRHPTRADLDRVSTRHRVIVTHISGHFLAANSYALEQSGIDGNTRAPVGGVIRRGPDGKPDGVMEESAMSLVKNGPDAQPSRARQLESTAYSARLYASKGFTLAQDGSTNAASYRLLRDARREGLIPIRIVILPNAALATSIGAYPANGNDPDSDVILGPIKHMLDGSIQGYTGDLTHPYHVPPTGQSADYKGYPRQACETLTKRVEAFAAAGWRPAIHANGDAAIDCSLRIFEAGARQFRSAAYRPVVIHAQMTREDQLRQMAPLGAIPSFFALHTYYWGDRHRDRFLGPERAARISPAATASRLGIVYTLHTDSPVVPVEPMRLMWAAVNRRTTSGATLGPDERVGPREALRAMTYNAAFQYGLEKSLGSIEVGKLADLVILDRNILTIDPDALAKVVVVETIVGGRSVFTRP